MPTIHTFRPSQEKCRDERATRAGYWRPTGKQQFEKIRLQEENMLPCVHANGELFERIFEKYNYGRTPLANVEREYVETQ